MIKRKIPIFYEMGEFDVNLIILIGFSKNDYDIFTGIFDSLIAVLYAQENVD